MFIEVVILAIIAGFLLKGNIKNFKNADLQKMELVFIAFLLEAVMVILVRKGYGIAGTVIYISHLLMYVLLLIFIYANKRMYQVLIMGAGFLLNAAAIFSNGGVMPVSSEALVKSGMGHILKDGGISSQGLYKAVDGSTLFPFLCDVIPRPYPRPVVISIGDVLIAIGLFLLVLQLMGCRGFTGKKTN